MKHRPAKKNPAQREVNVAALHEILSRVKANVGQEDYDTLLAAVDTLAFLTQELGAKGATIARLRHLLFGPTSEKTSQVLPDAPPDEKGAGDGAAAKEAPALEPKTKRKGHGRNGAAAFRGASHVEVPHQTLKTGDHCAECSVGHQGRVYPFKKPSMLLRVAAVAPISATIYELGRLRCNLCGEVFVADPPEGVGNQTYDETATAMIALMKYGAGVPFYRLEKLEGSMGIPLPASTQWGLASTAASLIAPAHSELIRQAAQGDVLQNDDTAKKILDLDREVLAGTEDEGEGGERTGIFTTGIVSTREGRRIALFFTGRKYAGENLAGVLRLRRADLPPPIQMCDGPLSRDLPKDFETVLANCLVHARRNFVAIINSFPDESRYIIEALRDVYIHDAEAKERKLSPEERLALHQAKSGPLMDKMAEWLRDQIESKKAEPNSALGKAITYMRKHWEPLTLFLRVPGALLDNNRCEQALKRAVLHRKNAYFYKTANGARVGDIYMSLVHTAELAGANPFAYLVALQRNADLVAANPEQWLPWNYEVAEATAGSTG